MTDTPLCSCGAPAELGAFLCSHCANRLRQELRRLAPATHAGDTSPWAGLGADLGAQLARQARIGDSDTRGGERPVPFHEKAADVRSLLTEALRPWALWIAGLLPPVPALLGLEDLLALRTEFMAAADRDGVPLDDAGIALAAAVAGAELRITAQRAAQRIDRLWTAEPDQLAGFLLEHVERIRVTDGSSALAAAVFDAVRQAERVIDAPPALWFAGFCGAPLPEGLCPVPLFGRTARVLDDPDDPDGTLSLPDPDEVLVCRDRGGDLGCGTTWIAGERRERLLAQAVNAVADTRTVTQALTRLGRTLNPRRLRVWKHRRQLQDRGVPCALHASFVAAEGPGHQAKCRDCGPSLWRVGDVIDLLDAQAVAA